MTVPPKAEGAEHPTGLIAALITPFRVAGGAVLLIPGIFLGLKERSWPKGEVIRQAHQAGNRSLLLVAVTLASVGMILSYHGALQAQRVLGDMSPVGPAFLQILLREFAPTIVALMVAARVGGGIAAEIATMVVTEQVDALRMNGADPVRFLVAPRFFSVIVMTVALTAFGFAVASATGALTARVLYDVPYSTFLSFSMTSPGDLITGLLKAAAYGVWLPLAAAWSGLSAGSGSEGVGRATTSGVVLGSIGVIFLSALIGAVSFGLGL
ncbi:MAG: MlaE family ABC transporter permease [Myxococcota bacterium]